ncbi:MAG: hypothetical protein KY455_11030 [Euryarchaeota archaeon]|nr:hypothetical protein [Euryarchaeota archaeon]
MPMARNTKNLIVVLLLAATAVAGCTAEDVDRETTEERDVELDGEARIGDINIDTTLPNGTVDETSIVCWTVNGSGRVAHVDVHIGPMPRALESGPRLHDGFAYYPDNETTEREDGYRLPDTFCTGITVDQPGDWWVQGHASRGIGDPGRLSSATRWNVTDGATTPTTDGTRDQDGTRGENMTAEETPLQTRLP